MATPFGMSGMGEMLTDVYMYQERPEGCKLATFQLRALMVKRWLYARHGCLVTCLHVCLPLLVAWLTPYLLQIRPNRLSPDASGGPVIPGTFDTPDTDGKELKLNPSHVRGMRVVYGHDDPSVSHSTMIKSYREVFRSSLSPGSYCMDIQNKSHFTSPNLLISKDARRDSPILVGAKFDVTTELYSNSAHITMTSLYNTQAYNAEPLSVFLMTSAVYRYVTETWPADGRNLSDKSPTVGWSILPLPVHCPTSHSELDLSKTFKGSCFILTLTLVLSASVVTSFSTVVMVRERVTGSKDQQHLSGAPVWLYYLSHVIWDFFFSLVVCGLVLVFLFLIHSTPDMRIIHWVFMSLGLALYCMACAAQLHTLQLPFSSPALCVISVSCIKAICAELSLALKTSEAWNVTGLRDVRDALHCVTFVMLPSSSLATLIYHTCQTDLLDKMSRDNMTCHEGTSVMPASPDDLTCPMFTTKVPVPVLSFIIMTLQLFLWSSLWLFMDMGVVSSFRRKWDSHGLRHAGMSHDNEVGQVRQDEGVVNERKRVNQSQCQDLVIMRDICKVSDGKTLIDSVDIGVSSGDLLCVLGQAGNGKTLLLELMVGRAWPTYGHVMLDQRKYSPWCAKHQSGVGYCPHDDQLSPNLTGRQTLTLYGKLRGHGGHALDIQMQRLLHSLGLLHMADTLVADYSGPERRKLSVATALVGDPPLVALDQPTRGLNMVDRGKVWHVLTELRNRQSAFVLSTSDPEESQHFGNRLVILVSGKIAMLTSADEIQKRYKDSYTAVVIFDFDHTGTPHSPLPFIHFLVDIVPVVEIVMKLNYARMDFPDAYQKLAKICGALEDGKKYFHVIEYSLEQTSVKHVMAACIDSPKLEEVQTLDVEVEEKNESSKE